MCPTTTPLTVGSGRRVFIFEKKMFLSKKWSWRSCSKLDNIVVFLKERDFVIPLNTVKTHLKRKFQSFVEKIITKSRYNRLKAPWEKKSTGSATLKKFRFSTFDSDFVKEFTSRRLIFAVTLRSETYSKSSS